MAYVAVDSWGQEVMFHNYPERTENRYWQDNIVYWESEDTQLVQMIIQYHCQKEQLRNL